MNQTTKFVITAAILTTISIIIPEVVPLIQLSPLLMMTITAHVPIFIACFISPFMAVIVSLGSTYGFFLAKPPIVTARVVTHFIFAILAVLYFKKFGLPRGWKLVVIALVIGIIHAFCEAIVMHLFFFPQQPNAFYSIYLTLGVWMVVYSCIDFAIAYFIWKRMGMIAKKG